MPENISNFEYLQSFVESMAAVMITDLDGLVVYMSEKYAKLMGLDKEAAIGKHVRSFIPATRMHIVAKTGKEELGSIYTVHDGSIIIIDRIPIMLDSERIGAAVYAFMTGPGPDITKDAMHQIERLNHELRFYKKELQEIRGAKYTFENFIGETPEIQKIKENVLKAAQTRSTILVTGETGTGKELVCHAIHNLSPRAHHPFVKINCSAIPGELLESELFGYEEGAFTGAKRGGKIGKFEAANYGTLFMDEISQLPYSFQPKLLRVLQEREIERVGSTRSIPVDVRMVFASNENLMEMVGKGDFRKDLYYRIDVVNIHIPPLRERLDDIPLLVNHLLHKLNADLGIRISGVSPEVIELFQSHNWPGNIRELEHSLERAANIVLSGTLERKHFRDLLYRADGESKGSAHIDLALARAKAEKEAVLRALEMTGGNVKRAADILNIHRSVLYDKINKYKINMR